MKGLTMFTTHMERARLHHRQRFEAWHCESAANQVLEVERTTSVLPMCIDRQNLGQHIGRVLVRAHIVSRTLK